MISETRGEGQFRGYYIYICVEVASAAGLFRVYAAGTNIIYDIFLDPPYMLCNKKGVFHIAEKCNKVSARV